MAKKGGTNARPRPGVQPSVPGSRKRQAAGRATAALAQGLPGDDALRWVVIGTWVLTVVAFWTGAADPVNLPKLTLAMFGAVAVTAIGLVRVAATRTLRVPLGAPIYALAAFVVMAVVVTLTAPVHWIALIGDYSRNIGLVLYLCCAVVFLAGVRVLRGRDLRTLAVTGAAVGGILAFYGLLQRAGVDPVRWAKQYNPVVTTMGNPDFSSALFGILLPLALWVAISRTWAGWVRGPAALAAALMVGAAVASNALQGWIAGVVGVGVLALGWVLSQEGSRRRAGTRVWLALAGLAVLVLVTGLTKVGPLSAIGHKHTLSIRGHYWDAAIQMFVHHPVTGVGMSMYGDFYRQYRSVGAVRDMGPGGYSNAAHDVPLAMLSNGGILLGLSYVAFVVAVGWMLVRALRSHRGEDVLMVGAVGGAWAAYQVQSLVSIDMVALAVTHFLLAAAVVIVGGGLRVRGVDLGSRPRPVPRLAAAGSVTLGAAAVLGIVVAVLAARPAWADHRYKQAADAERSAGGAATAAADLSSATGLAPWTTQYWFARAQVYLAQQDAAGARRMLLKARDGDPHNVDAYVNLARIDGSEHQPARALAWYRDAIRLDPRNPRVLGDAASYASQLGEKQTAERWLALAVSVTPKDALLWRELGDARAAVHDTPDAAAAYRTALKLNPGDHEAKASLDSLPG